MEMNFCRRCGTKLTQKSEGAFTCEQGHSIFANAVPASSVFFVTNDNQVLLAIRGREPYKGMLDTIGGFVDENESLEEAVAREIHEELGLTETDYGPLQYLCSAPATYPYENEGRSLVGAFFWCRLKRGAKPVPADDVADIRYLLLKEIDFDQIGNGDVKYAVGQLQKLF